MEINELTEREKRYLDYWITYKEERPVKTLLIVMWSFVVLLFFLFGIMCYARPEVTREIYLAVFGILICLACVIAGFTKSLLNRIKKFRTSEYEVQRTKIVTKEVYYPKPARAGSFPGYYYRCQGIDGLIAPVSKKLFEAAKAGDDITVVRLKTQNIYLGITFGEDIF